jgi:hypothetical protein
MAITELIKRKDLIGKRGTITKQIEIIDAHESIQGINVRIKESDGEEYWTQFDGDIQLD